MKKLFLAKKIKNEEPVLQNYYQNGFSSTREATSPKNYRWSRSNRPYNFPKEPLETLCK